MAMSWSSIADVISDVNNVSDITLLPQKIDGMSKPNSNPANTPAINPHWRQANNPTRRHTPAPSTSWTKSAVRRLGIADRNSG